MILDLSYLSYPLPPDIQRLYEAGDFARMDRVIRLRLDDPRVPEALKARLRVQTELAYEILRAYPYTQAQMLEILQSHVKDFEEEELETLRDDGTLDWRYVNGEVRFKNNALSGLLKTRAEYAARATDPEVKSLLDAGCGSGILSIAAALLGYSPVDCFDNDPEAVEVCRENLERNRITGVTPTVGDAAVYSGRPEKYDLVCANILAHLLLAFRENIVSWVRPGGYLALAGILTGEFDALSRAFQELGFRELERRTLREWTSGLFRKE